MGNPIILSVQITQPQPEKPKPRAKTPSLKKEDVRAIVSSELEKLPKVAKASKRAPKAQSKATPKPKAPKEPKLDTLSKALARYGANEHVPARGEAEPGRDNMLLS